MYLGWMGRIGYCPGILLTSGQVSITPEPKGAIVYKKVWETNMVKDKIRQLKGPFLYDNRKLAW
jgi:hypothetical protein